METLAELAEKYVTDKRPSEHNYVNFYDSYFSGFRGTEVSLCEIGILEHPDKQHRPFGAASLQMWADYFPAGRIRGIDIVDLRHLKTPRIDIYVGDQSNPKNLRDIFESFNPQPNIIIDDGSHQIPHQQITLGSVFKYLKPGGYYVIEDIVQYEMHRTYAGLYASPAAFHGDKSAVPLANTSLARDQPSLRNTTFNMLQGYCQTGTLSSPYISKEDSDYIEKNIDFINIHKSNMFNLHIAFLKKK